MGLEKLLEWIDMSVDELATYMVSMGVITMDEFAVLLNTTTTKCCRCGMNFVEYCGEIVCTECIDNLF